MTFLSSVFLLISLFNTPPQDTLTVRSSIQDVTLYRQQAQVQRDASLNLRAGRNIVVFEDLSGTLIENSVQLKADKPFTVLSLSKQFNYLYDVNRDPRAAPLVAQLKNLKMKQQQLNSDREVMDSEINLLVRSLNGLSEQKITAAELSQLLTFYRTRRIELEREKIRMQEETQQIQKEIQKITSQIREMGGSGYSRPATVIADIYSEKAQVLQTSLSYLVYEAGWTPAYEVHSNEDDSPLTIHYKAKIKQNTGIDWDSVHLTISSGNPSVHSVSPVLSPLYVDFFRPYRANRRASGAVDAPRMEAEMKMEEAVISTAQMDLPPPPPAEISYTPVSFQYRIKIPVSLASNGKQHTVEYLRSETPAEYINSAVPLLSDKSYLIARISDWDDLNILPGTATIHSKGAFIGKTHIDPRSVDEKLDLTLGIDEEIIVNRVKRTDFEERNLFGNKIRQKYAWDLEVRNTKDIPVTLELKDRIPVSQDESIEMRSSSFEGGKVEKETGIITWTLELTPGQSKTLRLEYELEYPKGKTLTL